MRSGIAKEVVLRYPELYEADCATIRGDKNKLGTFSHAKTRDGKHGYNLYSQYQFGSDGNCYTDYEAIRRGLTSIKEHIKTNVHQHAFVGLPCRMGCVRGGGDWNEVLKIIHEVFDNDSINLFICELNEYSTKSHLELSRLRAAYKKSDVMGTLESDDEK
jgi:hypothetical protein